MNSWRGWGSRNDFECPPLLLWAYSAERIFLIFSSGKSADFPELPFHGWGRKGRRYIYHFTCIPLCESRLQKHPQAFPRKTKIGARRWSSCMSRFCFSFALCAVPITPNAAHRAMGANKNHGSPEKREWNGGISVCAAMKAPVGLLSHKAVLRKQDGAAPPRQTWGLCTLHKPVFHRRFCRSICFSGAT